MKISFFLPLLLSALLFMGCNAGILPDGTNSLLRAPTLNAKQAEVSHALEATMNLQDIIPRYPARGSSPILFHELEGNGMENAVVFYSFSTMPGEIRVKILRRSQDGAWVSFHDIPGLGDQIEFVEFASLTSRDAPCMLLGWMNTTRQERQIEVYGVLGGELTRLYSGPYSAYTIATDTGGFPRLILVSRDRRDAPFEIRLLGTVGSNRSRLFTLGSPVRLGEQVGEILSLQQTNLWDGSSGVILDTVVDQSTVATEIIRYTADSLEVIAGSGKLPGTPGWEYYLKTFRPEFDLSVDIRGDGVVRIPLSESIPGIAESDEVTPVRMTVFYRPGPSGLVEDSHAVLNKSAGYLLFFPDRWLGAVTVIDNPETSQRSFHIFDERTQLPGRELLRIAAYPSRDYEETPPGYILLAERSSLRYYAYLPDLLGEALALSQYELRQLFALL